MIKDDLEMEYYSSLWAPTDSLSHYGIKGMKWGVRRYQNYDGSLTASGRKRYGSDLDINDKSRKNIASIRLGEARRRLDVAKENNPTNTARIAELQGRVRSAKKAKRDAARFDRGAKRAAKGETITGNTIKAYSALAGAKIATKIFNSQAGLKARLSIINTTKVYAPGLAKAVDIVDKYAPLAVNSLASGYAVKKYFIDNRDLRYYNNQVRYGNATIKGIGGQEYKDVVERRKRGE